MLCALEPSGDALGAALMAALRRKRPDIAFTGCGGPLMTAEGLGSLFPIDRFSVIGPGGALTALSAALKAVGVLARAATEESPAAVVFIDSWTFSSMAARKIKKAAPRVTRVKYVAPQIWASRPERAETIGRLFDGVMCLFAFEPEPFIRHGVDARWVGHPGFQAARAHRVDNAAFRARHGIGDAPLLAVLPGSRSGELKRLAAPFGATVKNVVTTLPSARIVIAAAPALADRLPSIVRDWPGAPVIVGPQEKFDAFSAADAALAASGTVTAELAIFNTPMAVAYRVDPLTEFWARRVLTTPYVSLVNIAVKRLVAPEFLQQDCDPIRIAAALIPLLTGGPERDAQRAAFADIVETLAGGEFPAADAAAAAVLDWAGRKSASPY
jgi:lipid-A-disaccharide synthase